MERKIFKLTAALVLLITLGIIPSFAQNKELDFEGDTIVVDPKTGKSRSVESLSFKAGVAEARINQYLAESRFKVRSGLEQAFKDYRVWFREWNHRKEAAVVKLIKSIIGAVYNMVAVVVPTAGAWQSLFKSQVVSPAMQQITGEEGGFRVSNVNQYLDLLEKKYGEYVLDDGMKVYDAFKASPEYDGAVDLYMEEFEDNILGGDGNLPAKVASVLDMEGVPSPTRRTQERARECALIGMLTKTLRPIRVPTGGAGSMPIWEMAGFDSAEGLARDVVGEAILDRSPFKICR
jgi:hypothetical protein